MKQDMIVILDLGSDENPRLAREIRALGVYSEIHPHDITLQQLQALPNVKGVILNGGVNRVVDGVSIDVSQEIYDCGLPVHLADHKGEISVYNNEYLQVFQRLFQITSTILYPPHFCKSGGNHAKFPGKHLAFPTK